MRKINGLITFSLAFLLSLSSTAQNGFTDNFSDGNHNLNPQWFSVDNKFIVNATNQLQLNDTLASGSSNNAFLITNSTVINKASWEFYVKLDFDPSTSNFAKVYLTSDNQNLTQSLNGYFVKIGGQTGTVDEVSLFRQDGFTETKIIDGIDGTVSSAPEVKIQVKKDSTNNWELFLDLSATGSSYVSNGTAKDSTYGTSSFFGVYCKYSSSRFDKFSFDDFDVNGISFQDTIKLNSLQVLNGNSLLLSFSELLDANSAETLTNYSLNQGLGNPDTARFEGGDSSKVLLVFGNSFISGEDYELISSNVTDRSSNLMLPDSSNFTYFVRVPANNRDIVINELYPDFNPSNGLPGAEFIELFNASTKVFDLTNWSITDGSSTATLSKEILKPGNYLIVCTSSAANDYQTFGTTQGVSSFPSLNNSGDAIVLMDDSSNIIDELTYNLDWYKDDTKDNGGFTLEQINPYTDCIGINNFSASLSTNGGTPGQENSVFDTLPDQSPPKLLSAIVLSPDSVLLNFNEYLDSISVLSATYSFSSTVVVSQIHNQTPDYQSVLLILANALDSGVVNRITVSNLMDCAGNSIGTMNTVDIIVPGTPEYRDIVINEIFPDFNPIIALPEAEFIELYNASTKIIDLNGWTVGDATTLASLENMIFYPGDYLIVCQKGNEAIFQTFGSTQGTDAFPSLNNSNDELFLRDNKGTLIDFVSYTDNWYKNDTKKDGGYTLEQINPNTPCTGENNFTASNSSTGGSPGQQNTVFDSLPDTSAPIILNSFVIAEDTLLIVLNEGIDTLSALSAQYTFSDGNTVASVLNISPTFSSVYLVLQNPLDSGLVVNLTIDSISDCTGNYMKNGTSSVSLPEEAVFNDLVINEILFNPLPNGKDFVEIYNRSKKVISLQNWMLANNEDDSISNKKLITELPFLLFPEEYLVVTSSVSNIVSEYPLSRADRIIEIPVLPSYNDADGTVILIDANHTTIDLVNYNDDQHFALLADDDGVSLERISSERPSSDADNFHSAAENVGFATPGYQNSQQFAETRFNGKLTIDPETFSPDNDGLNDIVNINYEFTAPGFVANVSIYDRNGRKVRSLVRNELLGNRGTFSWDGTTDDNTKARVGIYVILVEALNRQGDKEVFKEVVVLASFLD